MRTQSLTQNLARDQQLEMNITAKAPVSHWSPIKSLGHQKEGESTSLSDQHLPSSSHCGCGSPMASHSHPRQKDPPLNSLPTYHPLGSVFLLLDYNCLQRWISFCCTTKWISYLYTYILSLMSIPPTHPPSYPSRWSQSTELSCLQNTVI